MITTEEEAKTKLCVRGHMPYAGYNGQFCQGSRCMAWRWAAAEAQNTQPVTYIYRGYCGLAGKP